MVTITRKYFTHEFDAMGSKIIVQANLQEGTQHAVFVLVQNLFDDYEKMASRFIKDNKLDEVNSNLESWVEVPPALNHIIKSAYEAYLFTNGRFDPRILNALTSAGYVTTFENNSWKQVPTNSILITEAWKPKFDEKSCFIGKMPIDLGGIGKSYTAKKASEIISQFSHDFFINAGGDIVFSGLSPEGREWRVGVENPYNIQADSVAVLGVTDACVATSSIAKRSWIMEDERRMHHIIDPKTGLPSNTGIVAVTVVNKDVVTAEVWSKSLFLEDTDTIASFTEDNKIAAMWFTSDSKMHYNELMKPFVNWTV